MVDRSDSQKKLMHGLILFCACMLILLTGCGSTEVGNPVPPPVPPAASLASFETNDELEVYLKDQFSKSVLPVDTYRLSDGAPAVDGGTNGGSENHDFSVTNNQEAGVDESDRIKTDGTHLFVAGSAKVSVVDITADMRVVATIPIDGEVEGLFLYEQVLTVIFTPTGVIPGVYDIGDVAGDALVGLPYWIPTLAKVGVGLFDISNPVAPLAIQAVLVDGSLVSSRVIDGRFHLIQQYLPDLPPLDLWYSSNGESLSAIIAANRNKMASLSLDQLLPQVEYTHPPAAVDGRRQLVAPQDFVRPEAEDGGGSITTVTTFDLTQPAEPFTSVGIVADAHAVYASTQALYTVSSRWTHTAEENSTAAHYTVIYKFDLGAGKVTAAAGGRVPGWILNQFSLGEHEGILRVATSSGNFWWQSQTQNQNQNQVYCLAQEKATLAIIGKIENIAPGEKLYAARFIGERGFLVTFVDVDPLFTMDLTDPTNPTIVGELKVPGYSEYIHPVGEDLLLTLGKDALSQENQAYYQGLQLSLFDIQDFANPQLLHKTIIGDRGTTSEALTNHKAFTYWTAHNLLALPVDLYQHDQKPTQAWWPGAYKSSGLYVYRVSRESGFTPLGILYTTEDPQEAYPNLPWTRGLFWEEDVLAITKDAVRRAPIDHIPTSMEILPLE